MRTAFDRACAHYDRGQLPEALAAFTHALDEQPGDVNVLYRSMLTLVAMRKYAECAAWLQELLPHVNPASTPPSIMGAFHYNLAVAYEASGQWSAAERHHRNALAFDPTAVLPTICIGSNHYRHGNPTEGRAWHDRALIPPTVEIESRPARSFVKLLRGDYRGGFAEYESRWKLPQVIAHSYIPDPAKTWRWKGKPLAGARLLVVGEQGIGDTILMSRYVPLIEALGGKIVLVCNPVLHRFFRHNFPSVRLFRFGEPHPPCQWWVPMMSLPFVFQTTPDAIPALHLSVPPHPPIRKSGIHVGYVRAGNPLFMGDADRSCPADAFAPLLAPHPNLHFHDLSEAADKRRGCKDFADTAALVSQCDAVVAVDTSVGHLAGALHVPTFLLPMTSLHWLWGMPEGDTEHVSPWYPTHTLVRRSHVTAWAEPLQRIRSQLIDKVTLADATTSAQLPSHAPRA